MVLLRAPRMLAPALLAALLLAAAEGVRADAGSDLEAQVKAAFLLNFAKFVEWPDGTFTAPGDPVTACVAGEDPFGEILDTLVQGESVGGRRLIVHRTRSSAELRDCNLVFVPRSERRQRELLSSLEGEGILTVGDAGSFLADGGVIRFVLDQNRVRFEINLEAAESHGLTLSSKLLRLARAVHERQPEGGD